MTFDANAEFPSITLSELFRRLADPDTPPGDIRPYLIRVPSATGKIEPEFQPNPALVTGIDHGLEGGVMLSGLNGYYRARRHRAYRRMIAEKPTLPRIVSEGDSWFQYPMLLDDIIDHLMVDHAVLSLDAAGDTLAQMIAQNELLSTVQRERASAVLLSAGGNDLFDSGNIANLIESVVVGATADDLVGPRFETFLARIIRDYHALLMRLHRAQPRVVILIHGYAAAFSRMDRWIGQPLRAKGVMPATVQDRVVRIMLKRFNDAQRAMAADPAFHGRVVHVDLTGLGKQRTDWHDEIHLNGASNAKAARLFATVLSQHLGGGLESGELEATAEAERHNNLPLDAVEDHARDLMALDENSLMQELDLRLALIEMNPEAAGLPSLELLSVSGGLESSPGQRFEAVARKLLRRWERELYDLLCGDDPEDKNDRERLSRQAGLGADALVAAVARWLVASPIGVPAALAGVLAALIVRRLGGAALTSVCDLWADRFQTFDRRRNNP